MLGLPINPDSLLVSHDYEDVFVSFHFPVPRGWSAPQLAAFLEGWLREEARKDGFVAVEWDGGNDHG